MKRYDAFIVLGLLAFLGVAVVARAADEKVATEKTPADDNPFGFYVDKVQNRLFFDGKKTFSVDRGTLDRNKAKVEVSIDDEPYVNFSGPVDFRQEGRHSLKYRVVNYFNQVLMQKEYNFYLDTSAPESMVQKPSNVSEVGGVHYLSNAKGLSLSSYDGLSGIRVIEVGPDPKNLTAYTPGQNLIETGKHTIYFRATDNIGNVESIKSFVYVYSNQPPTTAMKVEPAAVEQGKETYIGVGSMLSFNWDNPLVPIREVAVSIDGDRFIYNKPFRVGKPGRHTMKFYALDYAGNIEKEQTFRFITDDQSPKTVASLNGRVVDYGNIKFVGADFRLALTSSDQESGVNNVQFRFEDGSDKWLAYGEPLKLNGDGPHSVWFRSVDKVGNREEVQRISVIADITPPHSSVVPGVAFSKIEGKTFSTFPNVLMFKGEDNLSGLEGVFVSINDGAPQMATGAIPLADAVENKVVYRAVDKLGNEEEPHTLVIYMSRPEISVKLISQAKTQEDSLGQSQASSEAPAAKVRKKRVTASDKRAEP